MPVPTGYYYQDGGYWKIADGTGPYGFDVGSSTPVLITLVATINTLTGHTYKDGGYWNAAGEGPFSYQVP